MLEKKALKINGIEELNNIICPSCSSKLIFKSLNKNNQILSCSNEKCLFPMDSEHMSRYIMDIKKDDIYSFIAKLKYPESELSFISDTNIEDKLKKYKDIKIDSANDEISENLFDIQSKSFVF